LVASHYGKPSIKPWLSIHAFANAHHRDQGQTIAIGKITKLITDEA